MPNKYNSNCCFVIGVLDNGMSGLTEQTQKIIKQADLILSATRIIELLKNDFKNSAEIFDITGQFIRIPKLIKQALEANKQVVVLATGDPLCHGIGTFLVKKLGIERIKILPNMSMLQLAFAHIGESWQDAKIASIHGADTSEWKVGSTPEHKLYAVLQQIKLHDLLFIYTSQQNSPQRIARMLIMENMASDYEFCIFEKLLQKDQKISLSLSTIMVAESEFLTPNVIILKRINNFNKSVLFGYPDEYYAKRKPDKGLITRADVRAIVLAKMLLKKDSIVWDIGAASGSVGLEAAMLCSQGHVYAIEKNCADLSIIETNRCKMGLINYSVVCAKAPDKLDHWPDPDAVFIGGSSGQLTILIELTLARLSKNGRLILNFISLENLNEAMQFLQQAVHQEALDWDLTQLQSSHSKPILQMNRLQANNPVWILTIKKLKS